MFPVILNLIACRNTEFQDKEKGNLVFLGIKDKELCLFCAEIGGTPTLQLKVSTAAGRGGIPDRLLFKVAYQFTESN